MHLDELPADQRAVLGLLLKQGRGYADIAGLLRIETRAVRERALDALDALGPQDDALAAEDQDLVADRLLGQADGPAREEAEALLAESPAARTWARQVVAELEGVAAPGALPEIPAEPEPEPDPEPPTAAATAPQGDEAPVAADDTSSTSTPAATKAKAPRSSRLGTALIIGAALVAIVGIVVALSGGFGGGSDSPATAGGAAAATTSTPTTATGTATTPAARVQQQIELTPPRQGSESLGVAQLVVSGTTRGLAVAAQDLSAGYYAVWLYNSATDARFLGFAPQVSASGDAAGKLQGLSQSLPTDVAKYRQVVISRQTVTSQNQNDTPTRPGTIVLQGTLKR